MRQAFAALLGVLCAAAFGAAPAVAGTGQIQVGPARFTVVTPECIRLEYQPDGKFIDAQSLFGFDRDRRDETATITGTQGSIEITTSRMHLSYKPDGKTFSSSNLSVEISDGESASKITWAPGQYSSANLGGTLNSLDYVSQPQPLGEGVLSRDGWYLLDDSTRMLLVNDWIADRPADAGVDWYFFGYGHDYAAGLRALTAIGGAVPLPRKYVLGSWYSRWWKYSSNDYRQLVQEYHDHDFPLDVLVFDMYWHIEGWTGFSWNRQLLPDAEDLLKWLHDQRIHVPLNDHPSAGVLPAETMYPDFMKAMGQDPATRAVIPYDAGNRKYMDTLFQYAHSAREHDGADFWWLDWMGDQTVHFDKLPWLNEYYYRHSESYGERGQGFARWADWGDHRHPIHFSGDTYAAWWMLEYEVPFTSTAGNVGAFYWSHDVGGFMPASLLGSFAGSEPPELLARWAQFGALSPILRLHSTQDPRFDKRPWNWGTDVENSMRTFFHLRSELVPYLYSAAWQGHQDSMPLARPVYLTNSKEADAYRNPQEYLLGDSLLVAPVTRAGRGPGYVAAQAVWFPPSQSRWYQWFTGEAYSGGSEHLIASDLNEMPLFAQGGVPIALQPYSERPATEPLNQLVVRAYPGVDKQVGTSFLYEDDGITQGYETGANALTPLTYQRAGNQVSIEIQPTIGTYPGQLAERSYSVEFPSTDKATAAWVNSAPVEFVYDETAHVNRVAIPAQSIRQGVLVTVQATETDDAPAAASATARRITGVLGDRPAFKASGDDIPTVLAISGQGVITRGTGIRVFVPGGPGIPAATVVIEDQAGAAKKTLLQAECQAGTSCAYDLGPPIDDGSMPPGMVIVRTAAVKMKGRLDSAHTLDFKTSQELGRVTPRLRAWSWVGPFDYDPTKPLASQQFGPEKESKVRLRETYSGSGGRQLHWATAPVGADGSVDLAALVPDPEHKIAYAVTYLRSDTDQGINLSVQSDDGVEAYLDGIKVLSHDTRRAIDSPPDTFLASLLAGEHVLLLKISNYEGGWGLRVGAETGTPIEVSAQPF